MAEQAYNPNGAILWEGKSLLDGAPIVAIVTGLTKGSKNSKTGAMLQTWILRQDVAPHEALHTGDDASVCGSCKHRPADSGTCYVLVHNAPLSVWRCYRDGGYQHMSDITRDISARRLRIGSYGDPMAVPADVWLSLIARTSGHTGYTHQWATRANATEYRGFLMASVDNVREQTDAQAQGWRTFRVLAKGEARPATDIACPAGEESGRKTTCAECSLCRGASEGNRKRAIPNVAIIAHGAKARRFKAAA